MRHRDRQNKQEHDPLANEEGVARRLQKEPSVLGREVARMGNDKMAHKITPEGPDHASRQPAQPYPASVQAHKVSRKSSLNERTKCTPVLAGGRSIFRKESWAALFDGARRCDASHVR